MATKRMLQKLLGVLLHLSRVVRQGRLFVNRMLCTMRKAEHQDVAVVLDAEFKKDVHGGLGIFASGMASLCSNLANFTIKYNLTPAQMDGGMGAQGSEDTISSDMSSSAVRSPTTGPGYALKILSWWRISLHLDVGAGLGMVFRYLVRLTLNPVSSFFVMGVPRVPTDLVWPVSFATSNSSIIFCGILQGFAARQICCLTVLVVGPPPSVVKCLLQHWLCWKYRQQSEFTFQILSLISTLCNAGFTGRTRHHVAKNGLDIPISSLLQEAAKFKDLAWADSTKKSLSSSQKAYLDFCTTYELVPMPAEPSHLTLFAVWLVISGRLKSVPSIKNYLSSVRTLHKMHGLDCPTPTTYPDLQYTLRGIAASWHVPRSAWTQSRLKSSTTSSHFRCWTHIPHLKIRS